MKKSELLLHVPLIDVPQVLRLKEADIRASVYGARKLPLQFIEKIASSPHELLKPMVPSNEDISFIYSLKEGLENGFLFYFYKVSFFQKSAEFNFVHVGQSNVGDNVYIMTSWNVKQRFPKSITFFSEWGDNILFFLCLPIIPRIGDEINQLHELNGRIKLNVFNGGQLIDWIVPGKEGDLQLRYRYINNIPYRNQGSELLHVWGQVPNHNRFIQGNNGRRLKISELFPQLGFDYSSVRK